MKYAFWNNKGGTGKTSIAFQTIVEYAIQNPSSKILAIDLCPQANLSELLMGGLIGNGGNNLSQLYNQNPRKSIGGYFEMRLSNPYNPPTINHSNFLSNPSTSNSNIPQNVDLLAGDRIVELQVNAISALSITQIPGVNTWLQIIDWLNDFVNSISGQSQYDRIFIDTNPSFSIYTQIALAASERIIVPVMADDSSRRALRNVFSLVYGIQLPSAIYSQYAFHTKLNDAQRNLPQIHLIAKNRLTQYMGPASAYHSVLTSIDNDLQQVMTANPQIFSFTAIADGTVDIRDFQTTGVVSYAKACPFSQMTVGNHQIFGRNTQVRRDYLDNCTDAINDVVQKI